jgi:ribosomal protein S18 acetylase RimI-like enzyme
MEYAQITFDGKDLVVRDLHDEDIDVFISYWHDSPDEYLDFLGVDRDKLGSRDDTRARFRQSIRSGDDDQERIVIVGTLGDSIFGYANLHFAGADTYLHAHIVDPTVRRQGVGNVLFVTLFEVVFREFAPNGLVLQTRPRNTGINHLLQKFGLKCETRHLPDPDGLPTPGEFCVYQVTPAMIRPPDTDDTASAEESHAV